jgi:hypothetical protein
MNLVAIAASVYVVGALVLPFGASGTLAGSIGPLFLIPGVLGIVAIALALQLQRGELGVMPKVTRLLVIGLAGLIMAVTCVLALSTGGPRPDVRFGAYVLVASGLLVGVVSFWSTLRLSRTLG